METLITSGTNIGKYGAQVMKPGSTEAITHTTSTQSAVFTEQTNYVRIIADADVFVAFGENPTATAGDIKIPANTVEYFGVEPGERCAVYDGTS